MYKLALLFCCLSFKPCSLYSVGWEFGVTVFKGYFFSHRYLRPLRSFLRENRFMFRVYYECFLCLNAIFVD